MKLIRARESGLGLAVVVGFALAVPLACGGKGSGPTGGTSGAGGTGACVAGNERCACYANATCNGGLTCLSNVCVSLGGGGAGGAGVAGTTGGGGNGGVAGTTGGPGTGGSSSGTGGQGGTPVSCSNADKNTLPIDATGWVARACNNRNIQGAWYCFDDNINNTSCVDGQAPYRASSNGMCLSGTTTNDPTFAAYGAALALGLNQPDTGTGKSAYNATANGVTGFRVQITGNLGGNPLRIGFTGSANPGTSPFVEVTAAGTHNITIASAMVPTSWGIPESGQYANPASIFDVQFMLPGGSRASTYDFCVTSVTPIVSTTSGAAGTTGAAGRGGTTGTAGTGGVGGTTGAAGRGGTTGTAGTTGSGGTTGGTGGSTSRPCNVADDCNFGEACVELIPIGRRCTRFNCTNELGNSPCRRSAANPYTCWQGGGGSGSRCALECIVDGDCPTGTFCRSHVARPDSGPLSEELRLCRVPCSTADDCQNMVTTGGNAIPCMCQPPGSLNAGQCLHNVSTSGAGMTCMYLEQPPAN